MRTVLLPALAVLGFAGLAACDLVFPPHATSDAPAPDAVPDIIGTISVDEPIFLSTLTEIRLVFVGERPVNYDLMAPGTLGATHAGTALPANEVKVSWVTPNKMEDVSLSAAMSYDALAPDAQTVRRTVPILQRLGHFLEVPSGGGATMVTANDAVAVHFKLDAMAQLYLAGAQVIPNGASTKRYKFAIYRNDPANNIPSTAQAFTDVVVTPGPETLITGAFSNTTGPFLPDDYWIVMFTESDTAVRDDGGTTENPPARIAPITFPGAQPPPKFPLSSGPSAKGISLFAAFGAVPSQ